MEASTTQRLRPILHSIRVPRETRETARKCRPVLSAHVQWKVAAPRRSAALRLSKKRYPAGPQGYHDPTLMMRAPPKATSFLLEHVPEQEGGFSRLPQRCSAPSHHTELPQPTAVTLPKASKPPVVCPLPWPSVLAPVRVIAQPLSHRRPSGKTADIFIP